MGLNKDSKTSLWVNQISEADFALDLHYFETSIIQFLGSAVAIRGPNTPNNFSFSTINYLIQFLYEANLFSFT